MFMAYQDINHISWYIDTFTHVDNTNHVLMAMAISVISGYIYIHITF